MNRQQFWRRCWWTTFVLLLGAPPLLAQDSLLPQLQAIRAEYPAVLSQEQKGELLNRVAWAKKMDGWGLHLKTGGNLCPQPHGVTISCDILVHGPSWSVYDVLQDETIPVWNFKGPINDPQNFVQPTDPQQPDPLPPSPQPVPSPQPPPTPVPAIDLGPLRQELNAAHALIAQMLTRNEELATAERDALEALSAQLTAHDNEPSWLRKFITSPAGAAILTAITTYVTTKQVLQ